MDEQLKEIQRLLDAADGNLTSARDIVRELSGTCVVALDVDKKLENLNITENDKIIEGVFDGEAMVAPDGHTYPVPPNYASKSKLVEGDTLKLTITDDGGFVFKQIAPVERRNAIGTLATSDGNYTISAEGKSYKVLTASVTFYKAEPGDQVTIILPKEHDAVWAVLENVIKKASQESVTEMNMEPEITIPEPATLPVELPVTETPTEEPQVDNPVVPEMPIPEVAAPAPTPAASTEPQIEFPSGSAPLSDDQLLANLKENLKSLEQPQYTAPEVATAPAVPKQVDNIVANDLDKMSAATQNDKQIAELDI